MTRNWNHVELIGNLTHDPELRTTTNGTSVCGFRIATNRRFKDSKGQIKEDTAYHRIIAWGALGEQCATLLKKGAPVFVSGRLSYREYSKDDEKRQVTEIVIDDMIVLDKRPTTGSTAATGAETPLHVPAATTAEELADEIPF